MKREGIDKFSSLHPTEEHELVLRVQRPALDTLNVLAFNNRPAANRAFKQDKTK